MLEPETHRQSEPVLPAIGPTQPAQGGEFDLAILQAVVGPTIQRFEPRFVPIIDSTMNLQSYCEDKGIPVRSGLVVIAGTQTHGVGRTGVWESSSRSKDITMSVVLPDTVCPRTHLLLHIAATLAVANALDRVAHLEPKPESEQPIFRIKLPNDVRVDCGEHFGKICGSLGVGILNSEVKEEHRARGWRYPTDLMVMGIGVNLSDDILTDSSRLRFPASSLERVTGRLFPREIIIGLILTELDRTMTLLESDRDRLVREAWLKLAIGVGGAAILDTRSGFSGLVQVLHFSTEGVSFLHDGQRRTAPLDDILRLYPEEQPTGR